MVEQLEAANNRKLNDCDKKAYDLLIKIEKEISWEVMLKIKGQVFLSEGDEATGWENPYLNAEYAKRASVLEKTSNGKNGQVNESFIAIQQSAMEFLKNKNKDDESNSDLGEGEVDDVIYEDGEEESKASHGNRKRTRKNEILGKATVEDRPVTFASLPSEGEGEEEEDEMEMGKSDMPSDNRKKRLASKIDKLFMMLYEDLNLLIAWENEEKKKVEENAPNAFSYNGIVWVHRGMLAERISRKRLAEKAYRNSIERGFSMYAWHRLLEIYCETYNPKA